MSTITTKSGCTIELTEEGFLVDPTLWSEEVAEALARLEEVKELTERHWKVIYYMRNYYQKNGIAPMIRSLCNEVDITLRQLYDYFPSGPIKGACKIAGLPKPTGCV
ncbi:TusE/DsrC/DsvC family sulfur relay protein [Heliorestis convoluta]|uniref:TusE/DsrC/DsvC family sulfur relay protein n=1 Tax=Heliorestis convoluta TaxID=356322 RepID=A0A5Q2N4J5_9FIRM|nr:TusE/DsrC/DsvC family sulfur relay protein [Heliorestis convoluta]QGG49231.1 TusE/DsrC/DsvC family sulfur relay protein [Heliorestis convoluta]